jgi:hypothetical protein
MGNGDMPAKKRAKVVLLGNSSFVVEERSRSAARLVQDLQVVTAACLRVFVAGDRSA